MPEHPGFDLQPINGRTMVRLRVRPGVADAAGTALQLPPNASQWRSGATMACWLGPDQWLLTSDTKPAEDIIAHIDRTLSGQLHAATDMSSSYACFALKGPAARTVLAMGCGIDMHTGAFMAGQCVRTHFANVLLMIVAVEDNHFDLYLDRSLSRYLDAWFEDAGQDPMTHGSKFRSYK
jgi:sarcosine oxidase subunit gamma